MVALTKKLKDYDDRESKTKGYKPKMLIEDLILH